MTASSPKGGACSAASAEDISAVGSLRDDFAPGDIVVPDQLIDFTDAAPAKYNGRINHGCTAEQAQPLVIALLPVAGPRVRAG